MSDHGAGPSSSQDMPASDNSSSPRLGMSDITGQDEHRDPAPFNQSDEEEDQEEDLHNAIPLSPTIVCLYLLSPYLKLGAFLLPTSSLSLAYRILSLACFSLLAVFTRHMWCLLARHFKKYDTENIVLAAFASGRTKARRRAFLRVLIPVGTASSRVMLAAVYLRNAVTFVQPFLPKNKQTPLRILLTVVFTILIFPCVDTQSLASKRVIFPTWLSIITFTIWLGAMMYSHAVGDLQARSISYITGPLMHGPMAVSFTFTSYSTVALYASLKSSIPIRSDRARKSPKSHSFRRLSILSVAIAFVLLFPLTFLFPSSTHESREKHILPPSLIPGLSALTLFLSIPFVLMLPNPSTSFPSARPRLSLSSTKALQLLAVLLLSTLPTQQSRILCDVVVVVAFLGTYFLPALIHVTVHHFKRPLSIVMPDRTPSLLPSSAPRREGDYESREPLLHPSSPLRASDPLLQRKESSLQRKRLRKRIAWDIAAWVLLLPVGVGGIVWIAGRSSGFV